MKLLDLMAVSLGFCPFLPAGVAFAQIQTHALVPTDAAYETGVGMSLGLSGDWVILGGPWSPEPANGLGAIWFYQRQGSNWAQRQHLTASDAFPFTNFGMRVAIDGDVAVASAPSAPAGGYGAAGRLYVFERFGETWVETAILWANDPLPNLFLGSKSLAISGTRILAGAPSESHLGFSTGVAYLFEKVGGTWMQVAKLGASDAGSGHFFGYGVAIEGDTAVIGAKGVPGPAGPQQGAVYVFTKQGPTWIEAQKLVHGSSVANDRQGNVVALSSGVIAAGAIAQQFSGAVYIFEQQGATWTDGARVVPADLQTGDNFATAISLSGSVLVAGSPGDSDQGNDTGAAYCFRRIGSSWIQAGKLYRQSSAASDNFGSASAISGGVALVAAPFTDEACPSDPQCNSGSAYFFSLPIDAQQYGSCTQNAPCGNTSAYGGCLNSTGQGAWLASGGSGSVSADDLVLEASQLPANVFGIFFMGAGQTSTPLGDGLRVIAPAGGSGLFRFGALSVNAEGRATLGPGIVGYSQIFPPAGVIQAGTTWNFQFWYRDVFGPCGNATNVPNGVSVSFTP